MACELSQRCFLFLCLVLYVYVAVPDMGPARFRDIAAGLVAMGPPDPAELAALVADKHRDKYDRYLSEELLVRAYAAQAVDVRGAMDFLTEAVES